MGVYDIYRVVRIAYTFHSGVVDLLWDGARAVSGVFHYRSRKVDGKLTSAAGMFPVCGCPGAGAHGESVQGATASCRGFVPEGGIWCELCGKQKERSNGRSEKASS